MTNQKMQYELDMRFCGVFFKFKRADWDSSACLALRRPNRKWGASQVGLSLLSHTPGAELYKNIREENWAI